MSVHNPDPYKALVDLLEQMDANKMVPIGCFIMLPTDEGTLGFCAAGYVDDNMLIECMLRARSMMEQPEAVDIFVNNEPIELD